MVRWRGLRRLLKAAFAVMVMVTGLIAAQSSVEATVAVVGGLLTVGVVLWWRRHRDVATSVVVLVLTCVVTGYVTEWGAATAGADSGQQTGLAFWIFAAVVTIAAWMSGQHVGSRGVTVALANAALTTASIVTALSPGSGAVLGLVAGMSVVAWRSGGGWALQRWWWRRRPLTRSSRAEREGTTSAWTPAGLETTRMRGEIRTAQVVATLPEGWSDLGSRRPQRNTPIVDHVLLSGDDTLLVLTRAWSGRVSLAGSRHSRGDEVYALDDDPDQMAERLRPIVTACLAAQHRLKETRETLRGVVVFWDSTRLPEHILELDVFAERGSGDDVVRVVLIRGEHLDAWLSSLVAGHREHGDERDPVQAERVAERMLPRVRQSASHETAHEGVSRSNTSVKGW